MFLVVFVAAAAAAATVASVAVAVAVIDVIERNGIKYKCLLVVTIATRVVKKKLSCLCFGVGAVFCSVTGAAAAGVCYLFTT